jgi:hypothetical protein
VLDAQKNAVQVLGEDDIGRKPPFLKALHHLPGVSNTGRNDQVGFERDDFLIIEADIASNPRPGFGLFGKIGMSGGSDNFVIETEIKQYFGDIGSQGDDSFRRKRDENLSSYFIPERYVTAG